MLVESVHTYAENHSVILSISIGVASLIVLIVYRLKYFLWEARVQNTSRQPTEIIMVTTCNEWENIYHAVKANTSKVKLLGLDCEWLPYSDNEKETNVALLQLATYNGLCILIRLNIMSNIPNSLRKLLADKSILKLGVSVCDDGDKLHRHFGIRVRGCLDLRHALTRVRGYYTCKSWGLYGLSECILGYKMLKDPKIRCGDWEAPELSTDQKLYAAMDALVGLDIYLKLVVTQILGHIPTRKELDLHCLLEEFHSTSMILQKGIVDQVYKFRGNFNVKYPQRKAQTKDQANEDRLRNKAYSKEDDRKSSRQDGQDSIICYCENNSTKTKKFVERDFNGKIVKVCKNCDYYFDKEDEQA